MPSPKAGEQNREPRRKWHLPDEGGQTKPEEVEKNQEERPSVEIFHTIDPLAAGYSVAAAGACRRARKRKNEG